MGKKLVSTIAFIFALPIILVCGFFLIASSGVSGLQTTCAPNGAILAPATLDFNVQGNISVGGKTLTQEQIGIAKTIIGVGASRGFSQRDIAIAVAVSMQETNLRNLTYGDRDSLGIYQQRPSQGWGTPDQIIDPVYASNKFYNSLVGVAGRDSMTMIEVGIKVQRPSPSAYYKRWNWDTMATSLVTTVIGSTSPQNTLAQGTITQSVVGQSSQCNSVNTNVNVAIWAALSQVGTPYLLGDKSEENGFDSSGLVRFAFKQADITLNGNSAAMYESGTKVEKKDLLPGDLVYWSDGSLGTGVVTHVAIYLGNDQIVEALATNALISVNQMRWDQYVGVTRPITAASPLNSNVLNGWQLPLHNNFDISSPFNPNRLHPILKIIRPHNGVDLGNSPIGTEVFAASNGTISYLGWDGGRGNFIGINHSDGVKTGYAHLSRYADGLSVGSTVEAGQLIGYVGSTGLSTSAHLHFEIEVNGGFVDPVKFMQERGISLG